MIRLNRWQWIGLASPLVLVIVSLLVFAGLQINAWGINWIWAVFVVLLVGWRWLLVRWTGSAAREIQAALSSVNDDITASLSESALSELENVPASPQTLHVVEGVLQEVLRDASADPPVWEDWGLFWERCRSLVSGVAHVYHPDVKYPLLNIYVPQAYGLIRGTVDDVDRWMQSVSPVLSQVTVGQAYEAYEVYQKLEPSARKLWKVWNWVQWVLNPAVAVAQTATRSSSDRATQELLVNLNQMMRAVALKNLCRQAIALYSGTLPDSAALDASLADSPALPKARTQTLQDILEKAEPTQTVDQKPLTILLVGRTGAGKSSLINTLFESKRAEVDVLPSTDQMTRYQWQSPAGDTLTLLDTPGYEQIEREDFRNLVLDNARTADLALLVTPALDPALQMDVDFLKELSVEIENLPTIGIVTQVDRLRPIREWSPPYDWQHGERPKEKSIREATNYRSEQMGAYCDRIFPVVTADPESGRSPWNHDALAMNLVELIDPAKELRLARFLRDRHVRVHSAARIIDRYTLQMSTTQGLTALLKSPILKFLSTLTTGSPTLAYLLAEQIPIEQLPVVIGKLQMAYDLFSLLSQDTDRQTFDLLALWPLLLDNPASPDKTAWAFGHALVEYWTRGLTVKQLKARFDDYLAQQTVNKSLTETRQ
ncbi:MAG: GTPase [Leptolyngbyaceae bacterium]|nr:GTPase [Leptolyngbyaceae bacterium]